MTVIPEHLGGYTVGGDPATFYPDLWRWCVQCGVRSVLDVGCGEGRSMGPFMDAGAERWLGIDGVDHPALGSAFIRWDFTAGRPHIPQVVYDLGWCCEVLEHVEERYMPNLLDTFRLCDVLMLTHAFPGQAGHHHVNCRTPDYWVGALAAVGFEHDEQLTRIARSIAALNANPWNHFKRSGLVFRNRDRDSQIFRQPSRQPSLD